MKVYYEGKEIGEIMANHTVTDKEIVWMLGYDIDDKEDLKKAYEDGFAPAYIDDMHEYCIDLEGIRLEG